VVEGCRHCAANVLDTGCRFFDSRLPSSITLRGHAIMLESKEWIEELGHQVIYGDTDSLFVLLRGDIDRTAAGIQNIGSTMTTALNHRWTSVIRERYQLQSCLEIEFETHFRRFIMPTIRGSEKGSKKRYAGLVMKDFCDLKFDETEASETLELVFKGLETVRTDWTPLAREFQKELYRRVFYNEPYQAYIVEIINAVRAGTRDDQLVYRKRIRRRLKDYVRNVPPHVQAARLADQQREKQGLPPRYHRGGWIQYVLTLNGPEPLEYVNSRLDYDLYVERQIEPIVDGIVHFLGSSFRMITDRQIALFP